MGYCPDCGSEVRDGTKFCPDCGNGLQSDGGATASVSEPETAEPVVDEEEGGIDVGRAIASVTMGIVVGVVVAFAFTNFGAAPFWFAITVAGVGYFLYSRQETVKLAAGMGLYITALWMPLAPIVFYVGLLGGTNTETATGAGAAVGSVLGMFIYGFIGLILGLILAVIGYFIRKGERDEK